MSVDAGSPEISSSIPDSEKSSTQPLEAAKPEFIYGPNAREKVQDAVNDSFSRWRSEVSAFMHDAGATHVSLEEAERLLAQGKLHDEQRKNVSEFFMLDKGLRDLTGEDDFLGNQPKDTLSVSFQEHQPGGAVNPEHTFQREEGLNIRGLLSHIEQEIAKERENPNHFISPQRYNQLRHEYQVLLSFSSPYKEVYKDAEALEEHSRIGEEARRIHENGLRMTGDDKQDWEKAEQFLHEARLLRIPPQAETVTPEGEPTLTPEQEKEVTRRVEESKRKFPWLDKKIIRNITLIGFLGLSGGQAVRGPAQPDLVPPGPPPRSAMHEPASASHHLFLETRQTPSSHIEVPVAAPQPVSVEQPIRGKAAPELMFPDGEVRAFQPGDTFRKVAEQALREAEVYKEEEQVPEGVLELTWMAMAQQTREKGLNDFVESDMVGAGTPYQVLSPEVMQRIRAYSDSHPDL